VCGCEQAESLLCHADTSALERELGDVASIVADLDITLSKQARIGGGGKGGLARERIPINTGAMVAADNLGNTLTTWARDVSGETWRPKRPTIVVKHVAGARPFVGPIHDQCEHPSCERMRTIWIAPVPSVLNQVAAYLLSHIPEIRRHPAVIELVDEITDAIRQARRAVDRPADRIFVGPCMAENPDDEGRQVTCLEDLYARPQASEVRCKVCGTDHPVAERRSWLLEQARDRLFTVREAAQMMGDVGGIKVTEASIRGYIHRGRIVYHTGTLILLGDLLKVVVADGQKKGAA
jgi:hypothetical protein